LAAVPPAHFEHIAKTPRSDDANLGAAPLEQRVRADRRAVHDRGDCRNPAERFQAIQETLRLVTST
jgi:hypothetical protein